MKGIRIYALLKKKSHKNKKIVNIIIWKRDGKINYGVPTAVLYILAKSNGKTWKEIGNLEI